MFAYILLIICTCAIKVTFNFEHTFPSRIIFPWMNCVMCGNFWCCYTTAIFSSMPTQILHSFPFKLLIPNLIHVVRNTNTDWIKCSVNKYFENLHPVILWKFIAIHITHFIWYVVIITEIFYAYHKLDLSNWFEKHLMSSWKLKWSMASGSIWFKMQ